jgi:hypothetical protein
MLIAEHFWIETHLIHTRGSTCNFSDPCTSSHGANFDILKHYNNIRFEVFTAVKIQHEAFCVVTLHSVVERYQPSSTFITILFVSSSLP